MLCGFALENILKGLVIAKTPLKKRQQIYNYASRELSKRLCTHNLEDLWRMVGGLGYEVPPPILGRLTIAVLSNGRYPVASKIGTFAKGWSWGSTDWTTVKELVDEIKKSYPA